MIAKKGMIYGWLWIRFGQVCDACRGRLRSIGSSRYLNLMDIAISVYFIAALNHYKMPLRSASLFQSAISKLRLGVMSLFLASRIFSSIYAANLRRRTAIGSLV